MESGFCCVAENGVAEMGENGMEPDVTPPGLTQNRAMVSGAAAGMDDVRG